MWQSCILTYCLAKSRHSIFGFLIASYNFNNNEACTSYCTFDLKCISSMPLYFQKTVTISLLSEGSTHVFLCGVESVCFHCLYCDESRFGHDQNFWKFVTHCADTFCVSVNIYFHLSIRQEPPIHKRSYCYKHSDFDSFHDFLHNALWGKILNLPIENCITNVSSWWYQCFCANVEVPSVTAFFLIYSWLFSHYSPQESFLSVIPTR